MDSDKYESLSRREKISKIYLAMDFEFKETHAEAWNWLESNLEWINSSLLDVNLQVNGRELLMKSIVEKPWTASHCSPEKSHDEITACYNRFISSLEEHSSIFGQLMCLAANVRCDEFMETDVKYLIDYLKQFNIYIKNLSEYSTIPPRCIYMLPNITDVYSLCTALSIFVLRSLLSNSIEFNVAPTFLAPFSLIFKLISSAGFFDNGYSAALWTIKSSSKKLEGVMLVFSDADVDCAIDCLIENYMQKGFWIMRRVIVQEKMLEYFIKTLLLRVNEISFLPSSFDRDSVLLEKMIAEAKSVGIDIHTPENDLKAPIIFSDEPPVCLDLIKDKCESLPFIIVQPFRTTEESITIVNKNPCLRSASVWTESHSLAMKVYRLLRFDIVWVNAHGLTDPRVPFYHPDIDEYVSSTRGILLDAPMMLGLRSSSEKFEHQLAEKAQKLWHERGSLERANFLSDIAVNLRQRMTSSVDFSYAARIFSHFAEECRSSIISSFSTENGQFTVSSEPIGVVLIDLSFIKDFHYLYLALLVAPLLCYGNAICVYYNQHTKHLSEFRLFQDILVSSGLPGNLLNFLENRICIDYAVLNRVICSQLVGYLPLLKKDEYTFYNSILKELSLNAFVPKVLWTSNGNH